MINVALLMQDKGIDGVDMSRPELGNPGIGGTEFCFLLLARFLKEQEGFDVTIYHFGHNVMPANHVVVDSEEEAFRLASEKDGQSIVMFKNLQEDDIYASLEKFSNLRVVIWCHNFMTYHEMKFFDSKDYIKRIICVGRQMYDYYIDQSVIRKMDYVFNMFVPEEHKRKDNYDLNVTYIGSLISQKHFHVLAWHWKEILKEVPEAKLHVIGTGKLYDRTSKLGAIGIADSEYEDEFLPWLTGEDGKLLDSVIFHGLLGQEKYDVFENTAVGVVNPMAATETFCLCAVEMESVGVPIVTRRKNGLLDTVKDNETGLLYKEQTELTACVVRLLKDKKLNDEMGERAREFAMNEFLPEKIMPEWIRVLSEVAEDKAATYHRPVNHFDNNGKRLRSLIHGIHSVPFLKWVPSIHDIQKK